MLFLQSAVVGFAFFILLISLYTRQFPKGIFEWIIFVMAFIILVSWAIIY